MKNKCLRKLKFKKYTKYFYIVFLSLGCFVLGIYFTYSKFSVSKDTEVIKTTVGDFIQGDIVIGAYLNGEYSKEIPTKDSGYDVEKIVCDNNTVATWDSTEWALITKNLTTRSKCNIYFKLSPVNFNYSGEEQTFTIPVTGTYKLETWGAQGGSYSTYLGGYGAYSTGVINLEKGTIIYVNIGGEGNTSLGLNAISTGGYNGGGNGHSSYNNSNSFGSGGGGATHIALKSGLLGTLENDKSDILIVSGGGGGVYVDMNSYPNFSLLTAGHAGGYVGNTGVSRKTSDTIILSANGGNQTSGFSFGIGESCDSADKDSHQIEKAGGGGGFYGGLNNFYTAGGGSGYIGNSFLTSKVMYCYNCKESSEEDTKTISTTCTSETPTENCAKKGNGYAKITLISEG